MTYVGLGYLQHQETVRANKASEQLKRSEQQMKRDISAAEIASNESIHDADRTSRENIASLDRKATLVRDSINNAFKAAESKKQRAHEKRITAEKIAGETVSKILTAPLTIARALGK